MLNEELKPPAENPKKNWEGFVINDMEGKAKYKIGYLIGEGGYGSVYYAKNNEGQEYAIKISSLNTPKSEKLLNNLKKEDQSMQICESKFIMKCYQSFIDHKNNLKIIIMELCNSQTIFDIICERDRLSEYQAKCVIKQVLSALGEIHRQGHLHRDIKSENICLRGLQCVLCDFGCAKKFLTDEQKTDWRKTRQKIGTLVGTIVYKSPQILNGDDYGQKAELWAVGILFYQMITGILPFMMYSSYSDSDALNCIKNNIQKIYDIAFISQNYQTHFESQLPQEFSISQKAINFMKQLIVFQKQKRLGWKAMSENQYLQQEPKSIWSLQECMIPFENLNWSQVSKNYEGIGEVKRQTNQTSKGLIENKTSLESNNKVSENQKRQLRKSFENYKSKETELFKKIKKFNFQVSRLNFLMVFRGHLGSLNKYNVNCSLFGMLITRYCFWKSEEIKSDQQFKEIMAGNKKEFQNFFNEIIYLNYCIDAVDYQENRESHFIESSIKKIMAMFSQKFALRESQILNHEMDSVENNIEQEAKNFKSKFEKIHVNEKEKQNFLKIKSQIKACYLFLDDPMLILKADYQPGQVWVSWKSFKVIAQLKKKQVKEVAEEPKTKQKNSFFQQIPC